jgi:hypothetical protein
MTQWLAEDRLPVRMRVRQRLTAAKHRLLTGGLTT